MERRVSVEIFRPKMSEPPPEVIPNIKKETEIDLSIEIPTEISRILEYWEAPIVNMRPSSHFAREIWKRSLISKVGPTVHTGEF